MCVCVCYIRFNNQMGVFHLKFGILKTVAREIEVNKLNKISLIKAFVLFVKKIVSIEYDLEFKK